MTYDGNHEYTESWVTKTFYSKTNIKYVLNHLFNRLILFT